MVNGRSCFFILTLAFLGLAGISLNYRVRITFESEPDVTTAAKEGIVERFAVSTPGLRSSPLSSLTPRAVASPDKVYTISDTAINSKFREEEGASEEEAQQPAETHVIPLQPPCTYTKTESGLQESRPGAPCIPPAEIWPYVSYSQDRNDLGERVLAVMKKTLPQTDCEGFDSFSHYTWCSKAMRLKSAVGLSCGSEDRDIWGLRLIRSFDMPVKFYNCFLPKRRETKANIGHEKLYACLGPRSGILNGRSYESIGNALKSYDHLSVHLRLDTEVSGWMVLEMLASDQSIWGKIRSLDVNIVFVDKTSFDTTASTMTESAVVAWQVGILEQLREHFYVVGSTIELYRQGWRPKDDCPENLCEEPPFYANGGFSPRRFAASFVNRDVIHLSDFGKDFAPQKAVPPPPPKQAASNNVADRTAEPVEQHGTNNEMEETVLDASEAPELPKSTCDYVLAQQVSSRPGTPCINPPSIYPYVTYSPWRVKIADRILLAATPNTITEEDCNGWTMFGDQTWCNKAFEDNQNGDRIALSFGIEERDLYSEYVSKHYGLKTFLYDCFIEPAKSPPMAKTAPNGTRSCDNYPGHCYETQYESYRVCLGKKEGTIQGKRYITLDNLLEGHGPLSVHVKIDVEGSEWSVLESLIAREENMAKIRTLDMEIHFGFAAVSEYAGTQMSEQQRLLREVSILEDLLRGFYVTGSTLEMYRQGWFPNQDCPTQNCHEPVVHVAAGFSTQMFAISFVNKMLFSPERSGARGSDERKQRNGTKKTKVEKEVEPNAAMETNSNAEMDDSVFDASAAPARSGIDCEYVLAKAVSSRPGPPCIRSPLLYPYKTYTPWRVKIADRIVRAAVPQGLTETDCNGWTMFGDQTWCNLAFEETQDAIAFSFGIEERDLYSEYVSKHFGLKTYLYDCFIEPEKSPPMAKTAPNGTRKCDNYDGHCYETPYESFRVCVGKTETTIQGRQYTTFKTLLENLDPLSVHVKIDIEGSEWAVLESLLANAEDLAKVRTLDMEIHFGFAAVSEYSGTQLSEQGRLIREVRILEGLLDAFYVTGSTLEVYNQGWFPDKDCPEQNCHEPIAHVAGGFSPQMFAISFVNKQFWSGEKAGKNKSEMTKKKPNSERPQFRPASRPEKSTNRQSRTMTKEKHVGEALQEMVQQDGDAELDDTVLDASEAPNTNGDTCEILLAHMQSSRPGTPCINPPTVYPYTTYSPWRVKIADRILQASTPKDITEELCGGWTMFGDQTWCNKAFKDDEHAVAFSFGIEERDLYSEYVSKNYGLRTFLYDCFIEPAKSPPMAKTAPNGTRKCDNYNGHCYETPYESFRVCLGKEPGILQGKQYTTLDQLLEDRDPLSVHVKIDVEGSEWSVLEGLVANAENIAKIRTLDAEIHFGFSAASEYSGTQLSEHGRLRREVAILEGLLRGFYVTGSTLEMYRQGWMPEQDCPTQNCHEPVVHLAHGFSTQMFAISFVNKHFFNGQVAPPRPGRASGKSGNLVPTVQKRPKTPVAPEQRVRPCIVQRPGQQSSRPGPPCLPPAPVWPFQTNTDWRAELGERIIKAISQVASEKDCGGWDMFGDHTWCQVSFSKLPTHTAGFSFGVKGRDPYSEFLSNVQGLPTRLYDCSTASNNSPTMNGKAVNGTAECDSDSVNCYAVPFLSFRLCLGDTDAPSKKQISLSYALKEQGPISALVRIIVSTDRDWSALERLALNLRDQAKIRTLDLELNFDVQPDGSPGFSEKKSILRQVEIFEMLVRGFYVTGTTLEVYRESWHPEKECPTLQCEEPALHSAGGFSLARFSVSLVNKALVDNTPVEKLRKIISNSKPSNSNSPPETSSGDDHLLASGPYEYNKPFPEATDPVEFVAKYGFYLHVYNTPPAVIHQVRQIKRFFPDSPIYVMSDGGASFDGLCEQENCKFVLCPPANDRWHPVPFIRRLYDGALWLKTEYVILLEPDNTIHGTITREPKADAGGLPVRDRGFNQADWTERQAHGRKPGFKWTKRAMSAGLAGGAYFKRDTILDAFSDESVAAFDWNTLAERATKEIFSSDFAMQYLLTARGYAIEPWNDCAQMERHKEKVHTGAQDAAFRHYCACYPGGKPTYNIQLQPKDRSLFKEPKREYTAKNSNCQICYNSTRYMQTWKTNICTNKFTFKYSKKLLHNYFPDGIYPQMA